MCDTLVVVQPHCVLFAKNSDRPPEEAQIIDWQPAREHPPGSFVTCTHLRIPQARRTHAVMMSRPSWMWGAEMATNEHGVTIGNEAVFTRHQVPRLGLTGMDLLRLGCERASSATEAIDVMLDLIAQFGQGGDCDRHGSVFRYFSSFIIADRRRAFVLETAGPHHAIEEVLQARSISNGLTIPGFAEAHSDKLRTWASRCRLRQPRTQGRAMLASGPKDLFAVLRDHGPIAEESGRIDMNPIVGGVSGTCMHGHGIAVNVQTTGSWVSRLSPQGDRHHVTATSAPCLSLFKPASVHEPLTPEQLGQPAFGRADSHSLFWQHERLHRMVLAHPERLLPLFEAERNQYEQRWLLQPPPSEQAFSEGRRLLQKWTEQVAESLKQNPQTRWPGRFGTAWQAARHNQRIGL